MKYEEMRPVDTLSKCCIEEIYINLFINYTGFQLNVIIRLNYEMVKYKVFLHSN